MPVCLVCANPDLNLIDGSSIWAQTLCLALAEIGDFDVHFLAKSKPERDTLFAPLHRHPRIRILDGTDSALWNGKGFRRLSLPQMSQAAYKLDCKHAYAHVVVRGWDIAKAFLSYENMLERTWVYLTDIHHDLALFTPQELKELRQIGQRARRILCQSSGLQDLWTRIAPAVPQSRYALYTPVVPDFPLNPIPLEQRPRTAIYAGKFKGAWKTLEMAECWPGIRRQVPQAQLVMIGDKFHQEPEIPNYPERMRRALETTPGIDWKGALSRDEVQRHIENAALGLSWREADMDDSLEYSTKILEYGRAGCPAILNRNAIHEALLGRDYPLFANSEAEFRDAVIRGLTQHHTAQQAAQRLAGVAREHTLSRRVETLRTMLNEDLRSAVTTVNSMTETAQHRSRSSGKLRVLVAGHDLKFFGLLQKKLEETGRFEFITDQWTGHNKHDKAESLRLLKQADVIFSEWCLGNLRWYAQHKRPGQRLVARLHQQERRLEYIREANLEAVDHISFVGEHIRCDVLDTLDYPREKTSVISNLIDHERFINNKKMGDSVFTFGMIGITPFSKRPDLAVDTLELLLEKDSRYQLRIKGSHPFDYGWLAARSAEAAYYTELFERINRPHLRYSVVFDPPGPNVPEWLSLVGFVLSPSDFESFHLSVGEGMLTGSLPVVWDWDGARDIWPQDSIVRSPEEAAQLIHTLQASGGMEDAATRARAFMLERYNCDTIAQQWEQIISG